MSFSRSFYCGLKIPVLILSVWGVFGTRLLFVVLARAVSLVALLGSAMSALRMWVVPGLNRVLCSQPDQAQQQHLRVESFCLGNALQALLAQPPLAAEVPNRTKILLLAFLIC